MSVNGFGWGLNVTHPVELVHNRPICPPLDLPGAFQGCQRTDLAFLAPVDLCTAERASQGFG